MKVLNWIGIKLLQLAAGLMFAYVTLCAMMLVIDWKSVVNVPYIFHWLAWGWLISAAIGVLAAIENLFERQAAGGSAAAKGSEK